MADLSSLAIQFDETAVRQLTTRPKVKEGWFQWTITGSIPDVNKNGNMYQKITLAAVDGDGNTVEPKGVSYWLTFPVATPAAILEAKGLALDIQKKVPNTLGIVQQFLRAILPEQFPTFPKFVARDDAGNPTFTFTNGNGTETLSEEEKKAKSEELVGNILTFLCGTTDEEGNVVEQGLWQDGGQIGGANLYAKLVHNGRFTNVKYVRGLDYPPDEELVDTDDVFETVE